MSDPQEISNITSEKAPDTYFGFKMRTIVEHVIPGCLAIVCITLALVGVGAKPIVIASSIFFGIVLYTLGVRVMSTLKSRRETLIAEASPDSEKKVSRIDVLLWLLKETLLPLSIALPVMFSIGISIGTPWRTMLLGTFYGLCLFAFMRSLRWLYEKFLSRKQHE